MYTYKSFSIKVLASLIIKEWFFRPDEFKQNKEKEVSKNNDVITKMADVNLTEANVKVQTFRKEDYILNLDDQTQDADSDPDYSSDDDDDLSDIHVNTNRPTVDFDESSSDEDDEISEWTKRHPVTVTSVLW